MGSALFGGLDESANASQKPLGLPPYPFNGENRGGGIKENVKKKGELRWGEGHEFNALEFL